METLIFLGHITVALTVAVVLSALGAWLISFPERRFKEPREFTVRIIKKVPTEETDEFYRRMNSLTNETFLPLISVSCVPPLGRHPLQLIVGLNDRQTLCNCTPEFYEVVDVGNTITVFAFVDPKTDETQKFCFAP